MRNGLIAQYAVVVGAAAVVGIAIASIPLSISLAATVGALAVLGLAAARVAVRPMDTPVLPELESHESTDERLRLARLAYYAGAAMIGILVFRPALGFTASDWIFLLSLVLAVVVILLGGAMPPYLVTPAITVGAALFASGGLLSSLQAVAPMESAFVVARVVYLTLVWFWLGTIVLETRAHVHSAVVAWVCSAAVSSGAAVVQFFYGDVVPGGDVSWGRMTGFAEHFNLLGGLAATAFVPALMLAVDAQRGVVRAVGVVSAGLILAGLLLSGSVGSLLAASLATVLWLALRGVSMRTVLGLGAVLASGFVLMSATGTTDAPSPIQRVMRVTSAAEAERGTGGTVYTRLQGWADAWSRIQERPLLGVGLDPASSLDVLGPHSVHNMVLATWFTAGILGLIGILMIVGGVLATAANVLRSAPRGDRSFVAALAAALIAFVQHGLGEPILFVRYGWFPAALLVALRAQQVRHASRTVSRRASLARPSSIEASI